MKRATARKRVAEEPVPARAELGICCTCNHGPDCVNLKAAGQPIWYCDQFDTHVPRPELTLLEVLGEAQAGSAPGVAPDELGGLCSDCGSGADCSNRVPGVRKVYCEGYC